MPRLCFSPTFSRSRHWIGPAVAMLLLATFAGCRAKSRLGPPEGYDPASTYKARPKPPTGPLSSTCVPVKAEELRARKAIMTEGTGGSATDPPKVVKVTRARLWSEFKASCGQSSCHGARTGSENPQGKSPDRFTLSEETFHQRKDIGSGAMARIISTNPDQVMPPGSGDGSKRRADDPIRLLGEKLVAWEDAGFPDSFDVTTTEPAPSDPGSSTKDPYLLTAKIGESLTNLGSCMPVTPMAAMKDEMTARDALFAKAKTFDDLPQTLPETDFVSLDSEALARRAVYSFAPTYTLFSDNASKMRYVRVPMGKKIKYNPATKNFDIPANTRFYKTFLRKVTDKNGEVGYRKMETRLIVSRPDEKMPDGSYQVRSLMVVYAWDKGETMARKVFDPQRSLEPWTDRLCPYVTDERESRNPASNPVSPEMNLATCTYMTEDELANPASGKLRHYAIPSKERCIQCHMGSNNHSFILGFTPWHVDRRKEGEGGIFEAPTADELGQMKRLIDYGVIEGIQPGQAKLEESQGERKPRNDHELVAQGYMMGNCAFCHNPTGFPTVQNPILKDFELYPSATGGTFQFPLEKFSPRAKTGPKQVLRHPYITPMLRDFTPTDSGSTDDKTFTLGTTFPTNDYLLPSDPGYWDHQNEDELNPRTGRFRFIGPWRSLIWRNVYTPFTYEEDNTIFIHMPRNVPGFDCRAQKIMAEWMLSVPSVPKFDQAEQSFRPFPYITKEGIDATQEDGFEQPYVEVKPGDLPYKDIRWKPLDIRESLLPTWGYSDAVAEANKRVEMYRSSLTGQHCPDDEDIIDASVATSNGKQKAPIDEGTMNGPRVEQKAQGAIFDQVPDHAHWVTVDTSDPPGRWVPRRTQWEAIMVNRDPNIKVTPEVARVIDELSRLYLTPDRKTFSLEPVPLGLWQERCDKSQEASTAKTFTELRQNSVGKLYWPYDRTPTGVLRMADDPFGPRHVHSQNRGEAVFRAICMNCHGRDVDSRSPLASTIAELSGGETRVANLRDGIFGPRSAPGVYAESEFARPNRGGTPADWQARYMVFMGLGGTEAIIPTIALDLISTSPFYDAAPSASARISDANMLASARNTCLDVLQAPWRVNAIGGQTEPGLSLLARGGGVQPFVPGTGHFDLWASLCGFKNQPLVRVFRFIFPADETSPHVSYPMFDMAGSASNIYRVKNPTGDWIYPVNHPVGTLAGKVERGIQPSNQLPWCVAPQSAAERAIAIKHFNRGGITKEEDMPFCPTALFAKAYGRNVHEVLPDPFEPEFVANWTRTGGINVGVAAYYYMDGVSKGTLKPQITFDECKQ